MATGVEVLTMLLPDGGWYISGDDFDSIIYNDNVKPLTKKQFTDGFVQYDTWQSKQNTDKMTAKSVLLEKLGITEDEAKLLLG